MTGDARRLLVKLREAIYDPVDNRCVNCGVHRLDAFAHRSTGCALDDAMRELEAALSPEAVPSAPAGLRARHVEVLRDLFRKSCDDRKVWSGIIRDAVKDTPHHARALAAFEVVNAQVDALAAAVAALHGAAEDTP